MCLHGVFISKMYVLLYFNVSVISLCIFVAVPHKEMLKRVIHAQKQEHSVCGEKKKEQEAAYPWLYLISQVSHLFISHQLSTCLL